MSCIFSCFSCFFGRSSKVATDLQQPLSQSEKNTSEAAKRSLDNKQDESSGHSSSTLQGRNIKQENSSMGIFGFFYNLLWGSTKTDKSTANDLDTSQTTAKTESLDSYTLSKEDKDNLNNGTTKLKEVTNYLKDLLNQEQIPLYPKGIEDHAVNLEKIGISITITKKVIRNLLKKEGASVNDKIDAVLENLQEIVESLNSLNLGKPQLYKQYLECTKNLMDILHQIQTRIIEASKNTSQPLLENLKKDNEFKTLLEKLQKIEFPLQKTQQAVNLSKIFQNGSGKNPTDDPTNHFPTNLKLPNIAYDVVFNPNDTNAGTPHATISKKEKTTAHPQSSQTTEGITVSLNFNKDDLPDINTLPHSKKS